jgi:hypothetical protein
MSADVILDGLGCIDWEANGWPEPNPSMDGDTSTMPDDIYEVWADVSGYMGDAYRSGI